MIQQLEESGGILDQQIAAYGLFDAFGETFTYINENGNLAIASSVLKAFRRLTEDTVVWSRSDRAWRRRCEGDLPGRQQEW